MPSFINLDGLGASWDNAREPLRDDLLQFAASVNQYLTVAHTSDGEQRASTRGTIIGQLSGTLAEQPTGLTTANYGLLYFVTDYSVLVRWDGSAWQLAPGTVAPGKIDMFAVAPPSSAGYVLCNGAATSYLSGFGTATLTSTNITLPDLTTTAAYLETGAAYTGTVVAATGAALSGSTAAGSTGTGSTGTGSTGTGSTGTGSTGTGNTGTGTTGNEAGHTHSFSATTGVPNNYANTDIGPGGVSQDSFDHTHNVSGTTGAGSSHSHSVPALSVPALSVPALSVPSLSVPSLSVPSLSIPALGAGTLAVDATGKPRHVAVLPYFKR